MKVFWGFLYPAIIGLVLFFGSKFIGFEGVVIVIGASLIALMVEIKHALELRGAK